MRTNHPRRLATFDYLGLHRYSLTFCTDHRRHVFTTAPAVETVRSQILRAAEQHQFSILAYCFMPDHLHLLIEGQRDDSDCKNFIASAKQYSGFYYSREYGETLWQRYGF